MTIKNTTGISQGTEILDSHNNPMDLLIESINVSFQVDCPVTANVTLLKIPTHVEILPENIHFFQKDDLQEIIDLIKDNYVKDALAHLEYMKKML